MAIPPGAASPRGAAARQHQQQAPPSQPIPIPISIPGSINNNNSGNDNNNGSSSDNNNGSIGGGGSAHLPPPSPGAATLAARSPLFPFLRPVLSPRRSPYSPWTPPSSPAQWFIGSPPSSPGGPFLSSSSYAFPSSYSSSSSSSSSSPLRSAAEVFSFERSCDGAAAGLAGVAGAAGVGAAGAPAVGVAAGQSGGGGGGGPARPRGCDKCTQTGGEPEPAAAAGERRRQPHLHSATAPASLRQALHSDSDLEPVDASLVGDAIPDIIPPRERSQSESAVNLSMERVGQELRRIGDEFNIFVDGQQLQRRIFGRQNGQINIEALRLFRFGLDIMNRRNL